MRIVEKYFLLFYYSTIKGEVHNYMYVPFGDMYKMKISVLSPAFENISILKD